MKRIIVLMLLICTQIAYGQLGGLANKLKQKAKEAVERQTDKTLDKVVGKGENKVDETVDEALEGEKKKVKKTEAKGMENEGGKNLKNATSVFSVNSKYDFVAGEKVVAFEDFAQDALADFPAKWNTNANGEVVNLGFSGSKKWLRFAKTGIFYPEFINDLPENFTLEFDMATSNDLSQMKSGLKVVFPVKAERSLKYDQNFSTVTQVGVDIHPINEQGSSSLWVFNQQGEELLNNTVDIAWKENAINRISFWRQKTRLRMYVNEVKVWDIPRAFMQGVTYSLLLATNLLEGTALLSDLKLAVGLPDTRSKLITEGKFSTNGILFALNADQILPSSAGVLKEIATILNDNPTINIKIIGHTDTDGKADANLQLSKRRAEAVKNMLANTYGIANNRMQTDGKGATAPIDNNQTTQGKANNRRVEFVKL